MTTQLTPARRRGLQALALWRGKVRRSNSTCVLTGYVYWQTADWLVAQGYAEPVPYAASGEFLTITPAGERLAAAVGIEAGQ